MSELNALSRLLARLEARKRMNLDHHVRTPDLPTFYNTRARVNAYQNAIDDIQELIGDDLRNLYAVLCPNEDETLTDCARRLAAEHAAMQEKIIEPNMLPGWTCHNCHGFNGSVKELRIECRACGQSHIPDILSVYLP